MTSHSRSARFSVDRPKVYDRLTEDDVLGALRRMHRIRRFEEAAEDSYIRGLSYGTMHLSIGQEATAVGVCMPLERRRLHHLDPSRPRPLHRQGRRARADVRRIPRPRERLLQGPRRLDAHRRSGEGQSRRQRHRRRRHADRGRRRAQRQEAASRRGGVAFFGDGANNEGAFHEALNMASIWKLPVVFVCENNQYAMSMSTERSTAVANVAERASAYSMPGVIVDGNDFAAVAEASFEAVERARAGDGPTLIEGKTYRTRGHSRSDRNRYRTEEEIEAWKARDPIARFEAELVALGFATERGRGDRAPKWRRKWPKRSAEASASPWPAAADVMRDVYSPARARVREQPRTVLRRGDPRSARHRARARRARLPDGRGHRRLWRRLPGDRRPRRALRRGAGHGHADLRARRRGRRGRRGADRHAADLRVPVLRLLDAGDGADRQSGREAALHAWRRGLCAGRLSHAHRIGARAARRSTAKASRPGSRMCRA